MAIAPAIIGGIVAGVGALAGTAATGITSAVSAKSAADRAKKQRLEQRNIQISALEREDFERRRTKDRKRAADVQSEREAGLAVGAQGNGSNFSGTILGLPSGANTKLGSA